MPLLVAEGTREDLAQELHDARAQVMREKSDRGDGCLDVWMNARHHDLHDELGVFGPAGAVDVVHERDNAGRHVHLVSHVQRFRQNVKDLQSTADTWGPEENPERGDSSVVADATILWRGWYTDA